MAQRKWKKDYGYSDAAMKSLERGTYGKETGRTAKYKTSQEQTQQAKTLPTLKGMTKEPTQVNIQQEMNKEPKTTVSENKTVSENTVPKTEQKKNTDNYVVHRDRYDKLMQNSRLANDIKTLAQVNYGNADQDATVSKEWAENYGAKNITGGYTKKQYLDTLSRRYDLTPKELNDMALTFHSDANKAETAQYGEGLQRAGEKLPVLASLGSFIGTLGSGVEGLYNAVAGGITGDDRYLSNMFRTTKNAPREGAKSNIDSNAGKAIYDIGMGVGDMAAGAVAGSAPAILAGNTANEAQASAIDRGSSVRKASAYGTAAGALDYVTNTIGLDKAKDLAVNGIKSSGIKKILAQSAIAGAGEAGENLIQDLGQSFIDSIINGKNSELSTSYANKIASGMSESDALKETAMEYAGQLAMSAGTGFAMGSAMQGGSTIAKNLPEIKSDLGQFNMDNRGAVDIDALFGRNPELQEIINRDPGSFDKAELAEIKTKKKDVTAQLKQKNAEIRAQEEVLNNAPKKDRVAEKQKLDALNKEAQELQLVKKIYNHVGKGEAVPTKSLLMPNDYNNIFNEQTGTANAINVAVKFAGDTPQAKQLGKEAKQLLTKYVNTGNMEDYYQFLGKVGDLSVLAEKTKADYVTKGGTYKYDDIYGGTITDKAGNDIANTLYNAIDNGSIPEIVNNTRNKIYKNVGDVHNTLTPDSAPVEPIANEPTPTDGQLTPEEVAVLQDVVDGKYDIPETGNEIPTVKPTEPTTNNNVPELAPNNSIIARMMSNGGNGNNNIPPAEANNAMGNSKRTKTSETYTNTGKRGGGWNEAEYEKYTDESMFQYEPKSEQESFEEARNMWQNEGREEFKKRVMDKERLTGAEIDGLMIEWRILAREARALEESGQDASKTWKDSIDVFRKIQSQSTDNAQALQALAKWSRNTPEGMLAEAENIINKKNKTDENPLQKELNKFAKRNKKFQFSDEFIKDFLKDAEEIQKYHPDSPIANKLMADLGRKINRQVPAKFGEKFTSFLMDNMLGNFRTLITRNAGGNVGLNAVEQLIQRPVAAGIDKLASLKSGKRTQAGLSKEGLAEYIQGFAKGLKDEADDLKSGLHTARTGENNLERAISANRHVFKEGSIMDKWDSLIKNGLSVGDRPFYEAVYKQTLGDYDRLRATGQMGEDVQKLTDEQFKEYAETAAKMNALAAVYQNDTTLSKALLGFKKSIGNLSEGIMGVDILSQFSMPFVKTPANVVDVGISYSPVGLARNAVKTIRELKKGDFDQNRFANDTARNLIGTTLMGGAGALAANGIMSGGYSDDKDEKQAQKEAGMQEYALNMGDKQMDIGWLPVVGSNAVAAAATQDAFSKGEGNLAQNTMQGLYAGGKAMFDQSMFQGLQRLFGTGQSYNSDEGIVGNMVDVVKAGGSQLIPSIARQVGQVIDPYQRDLGYSNKDLSFGPMDNYDINSMASNVPILRQNVLAPKVNTSGELLKENQGRNIGMKILEDMILPGKITKVQYSDLANEAMRLQGETNTPDAYMPKADRKNVDMEDHTLTNDEWVDYQQRYYKELTDVGTKIIQSENYKNASPEKQTEALKNAYNGVKQAINSEYNGKEVDGAAKKYIEAGGGEKGVDAVVNYTIGKQTLASAGIDSSTKAGKEIMQLAAEGKTEEAQKKAAEASKHQQNMEAINQKYGTDMSLSDYLKHEASYEGGAEQWAKDRQAAEAAGMVNAAGQVQTKDYGKIMTQAGAQSAKMERDLPTLNGLNMPKSSYYTYAQAINVDPSLTPNEFAKTFNEIDTEHPNNKRSITQDEMLAYFNKHKMTNESQVMKLWDMYAPEGKKVPYLKKDGTWGKH